VRDIFKPSKLTSKAVTVLVHKENCTKLKHLAQILNKNAMTIKAVVKKSWLRIIKICGNLSKVDEGCEAIKTLRGRYKLPYKMSSKEIRELLTGDTGVSVNKYEPTLSGEICAKFFSKVARLTSTKHRNIALRVWNGDVLSNDRLFHMGLIENNKCHFCDEVETQIHLLRDCPRAKQLWDLLQTKLDIHTDQISDWTGINDNPEILETRCECWWYLLNNRRTSAEIIFRASCAYVDNVRSFINNGFGDINTDLIGGLVV